MIRMTPPRVLVLLLPVALLAAGCGGSGNSSNISISPTSPSIDTNGSEQFSDSVNNPNATVTWSISGGDSRFGAGSIDSTGFYLPPSALSGDSTTVRVTATASTGGSASTTIKITPGFVSSVSPENLALAGGAPAATLTAVSAEVNAGKITFALGSKADGTAPVTGSQYGSLGNQNCQQGSNQYTSCSATYTPPGTAPSGPLFIVGQINGNGSTSFSALLVNNSGINSNPSTHQAQQPLPVRLGSSGGNNSDVDTNSQGQVTFCAGGTLGALVQDANGNQYVLSNNHVLARSDQASLGASEQIVQPGLIDEPNTCAQLGTSSASLTAIGTLTSYVPISNGSANVDAAIARVYPGTVDPTGAILEIGPKLVDGTLAAGQPVAGTGEAVTTGLTVVKSGRTTGLTCSTISSLNLTVQVPYFKDVAETIPYVTKTYTNQIVIAGNLFSDSGDSGSLVLDASNSKPVALFFAGNGTESIGSPIADVLNELTTMAASAGGVAAPLNIVGTTLPHKITCLNYDTNAVTPGSNRVVPASAQTNAQRTAASAGAGLVNQSQGILGVATGRSEDAPGEAAVIVYVDASRPNVTVPATINGVRTLVIPTDAASVARGSAPTIGKRTESIELSAPVLNAAIAVKQKRVASIMADPAIIGVAVSQSHDNPAEAALVVYVNKSKTPQQTPATIDGLRVRYRYVEPFRVHPAKEQAATTTVAAPQAR